MGDYYEHRSHASRTLLIGWGMVHIPGIWNQEHIDAWRLITDRVHAKDCYIFCQLWAHGRAAYPKVLAAEVPSFPYTAPSDIPLTEIQEYVQLYTEAARNTIKACFDGVEIHGANGHLLDQFTQDVLNRRSDQYGGGIMNRVRFPLQVIDTVVDAMGAEKTGYRLSPWNLFQDMTTKDPKLTFTYLEGNDFLREIWAGGYDQSMTITVVDEKNDFLAFGRHFLANETFYIGSNVAKGYTDYPIAADVHRAKAAL
ncbi:hypothetical protein EV421DRAFT_1891221 [Armillaria borealis]|uniref:NADH:flavin oxidoreductase/NADH oxidase N-terminal domain-containing protein n=1 Tax=Armillaria borealis TaxID=47425 RepID=A0AA39JET3_9AGAR|nr:hypothetical protein EV421DRAFT_1891221 [Armillaria borealis]